MDGWMERREEDKWREIKTTTTTTEKQKKKETCDVGGMMVVSAAIGETGITGIMGEEGGVASAC